MLRSLAGLLATRVLRMLAPLPPSVIERMGRPLLPVYARFRPKAGFRLASLQRRTGLAMPSPTGYYRMRLRLAALSLRHLTGHHEDWPVQCEGGDHFRAALESGKPVALLGWHQGPLELLHKVPHDLSPNRPWFLMAAPGFVPRLSNFLEKGRSESGKRLLQPGESELRHWVRANGVLAAMVDQVPGTPGEYLSLWNDACRLPYPGRLLQFIADHDAITLPVTVRLGSRAIEFRYHPPLPSDRMAESLARLMETVLAACPDQYNWSYPKIRIQ